MNLKNVEVRSSGIIKVLPQNLSRTEGYNEKFQGRQSPGRDLISRPPD